MKLITWIFALVFYAVLLGAIYGLPEDPNLKCQMNCDLQEIKPICGTDDAGETKTFTNLCIMKTENCLRASSFQKTGDSECP